MAWTQYQAGFSYAILEHPKKELPYVQGRYIPAVRKCLQDIDGTIELENKHVQQKLRENDTNITETVMERLNLTTVQLTRLNCVRMYLGVTYLSEMCTVDGQYIADGVLKRERDAGEHVTTLTRPHQQKPNTRSWTIWNRLISTYRLGRWNEHHSSAGEWETYIDNYNIVWSRMAAGTWMEYKKFGTQI